MSVRPKRFMPRVRGFAVAVVLLAQPLVLAVSPGAAHASVAYWYIQAFQTDSANSKSLCVTAIGSYPKLLDCGNTADQQWFFGQDSLGTGEYMYNRATHTVLTYKGRGNLLQLSTYSGASSQLFKVGDPYPEQFNHIRPASSPTTCIEPVAFRKANVYMTAAACDKSTAGIQAFRTVYAGNF